MKRYLVLPFITLIRLYQLMVSPLLGPRCRYYPSCSSYAMTALNRHGLIRGSGLALHRLLRCHPGCEGGHDPVPAAEPDLHAPQRYSEN